MLLLFIESVNKGQRESERESQEDKHLMFGW